MCVDVGLGVKGENISTTLREIILEEARLSQKQAAFFEEFANEMRKTPNPPGVKSLGPRAARVPLSVIMSSRNLNLSPRYYISDCTVTVILEVLYGANPRTFAATVKDMVQTKKIRYRGENYEINDAIIDKLNELIEKYEI